MNRNNIITIIFVGLIVIIGGYFFSGGDSSKRNTVTMQALPSVNGSNIKNAQGYYNIDSIALVSMLKNKDFSLVNVHIPYAGELANTDAFIPYDTVRQNLGKLPSDKNAKIVLYCQSGRMSTAAAKELVSIGYTNVYNLTGGMNEWGKEGNAVIKK